jgi:hypothetical protein
MPHKTWKIVAGAAIPGHVMIRNLLAPVLALMVMFLAGNAAAADAPPAGPPALADVAAALAGTWQSTSDPKLTREFDSDGKTVETYEGDNSGTVMGRWTLFLGAAPPAALAGRKFDAKNVYLKLDQNGDVLLFVLVGLSRSDMKMMYLERGNLMSFERLK